MEKYCLECNKPLMGRSDKKFCDELCRNSFNNRVNGKTTNLIRRVNSILRKNRRILLEFNPGGKASVNKGKLLEAGFNFDYYTNTYTTKKGATYYFCYDQGYLPLDHDYFSLVVKKEYIG